MPRQESAWIRRSLSPWFLWPLRSEIFTIFYILTGIGVFVALLASVAQQYIAQKAEGPSARERLSARRHRGQAD
jgi:hypothetical protein